MRKKVIPSEGALFVRLPSAAVDKLDRAAEALGMLKKDLVAGLVSKYVDPDSDDGLSARWGLADLGRRPSWSARGDPPGAPIRSNLTTRPR